MGGNEKFISTLDGVFTMPPDFDHSYYGFVIHEIREMQIVNMGNYAHGNQPIQHMVYLYNYAGAPWKTQKHVRNILHKLYSPQPDGYCGDEDNGQTSAWYVFSALGFYPVCPGTDQYVFGSPLFDRVLVQLPNGEELKIIADNNSEENVYINKVVLKGKKSDRNYIKHQEIIEGGELIFEMKDKPNFRRGIDEASYPYSFSNTSKTK